ncbi:hypothetical protein ACOMHN_023264 [Nucella lapillus]
MAEGKFLITVITCILVITNGASQATKPSACNYPPCHLVPAGQTYHYPNWDNCDTYWTCENKQATLSRCGPGQVFDLATYKCRTQPVYRTRMDFFVRPVFSCKALLKGIQTSSLG